MKAESYLPATTHLAQRLILLLRGLGEKVTIDHNVEEPFPVLPCHIGDEPRVSLAMEANFRREAALDEEVGCFLVRDGRYYEHDVHTIDAITV